MDLKAHNNDKVGPYRTNSSLEAPGAEVGTSSEIHMGNSPTKKQFGMLNVLSLAFVICNSWAGVSGTLQLAIVAGGPPTLIYSILISSVGYASIACSMAELASVYPTAGGQYHFASILAPKNFNKSISYACGFFSMISWVAIGASVTIIPCQQIFAIVSLLDESFVSHRWQIFILYQAVALVVALFNIFAIKKYPWVHNIGFFLTLSLFLASVVATLVRSSPKAEHAVVWETFLNYTGWPDGVCFLIGLTTSCYMYIGLDAAMHLAEECAEPRRLVPRAIVGAVTIGFVTAFSYAIITMYGISDLEAILGGTGYIPLVIMQQNFRSTSMSVVFTCVGIFMTFFILNAIQETSSRLAWAFARDNALVFSTRIQEIHPTLEVPVYAIILTYMILAICGCIYMASTTAFNALIGSAVVFQQLSFVIPIALLIYRKRSTTFLHSNRLFRLPEAIGWFVNVFAILFSVVTIAFFNLPITLPTTVNSMNYTCVLLGIAILLATINWFIHAKHHYHGPTIELS